MKKTATYIALAALATSCAFSPKASMGGDGGEVTGVRGSALGEPTPYGMVLIERGSMQLGPNADDSTWNIKAQANGASVESFWMDETEVSNAKYRQFVYWVRDSIIRERLADPAYGGDEEFKIEEDKEGNPVKPYLNWKKPIPWRNPTEDEQRAIQSVYKLNPITGVTELDASQMNYRYETYNLTEAAKRKNRIDPTRRNYNTDVPVPTENPFISKDTAYVNDNGDIVRETITRRLSSDYDFLNTYIVNVYPDTTVWINDFENAYNEPYTRLYFSHPGYDDYPVVGVSWEQATAFCVWRTNLFKESLNFPSGQAIEPFRLPTEGEWEYAARTGKNENKYPWAGDELVSGKGCFLGNFKPGKGNYTEDGHLITSRVGSFAPNEFGLYDMAGNVAEWTSTSYSESGPSQMSDMNPDLRYNAAKNDPYAMKKKVVRGGSWKDVSQFIRSDMRTFEFQNESRSYIGFRCARTQIGFSRSKGKK